MNHFQQFKSAELLLIILKNAAPFLKSLSIESQSPLQHNLISMLLKHLPRNLTFMRISLPSFFLSDHTSLISLLPSLHLVMLGGSNIH